MCSSRATSLSSGEPRDQRYQHQRSVQLSLSDTTSPESGWYEFSTSNTLIINPVISASVLSPMNILRHRRGGICWQRRVGTRFRVYRNHQRKTAADEVLIKVTGPAQVIGGAPIVSSAPMTVRLKYRSRRAFLYYPQRSYKNLRCRVR